jgi:hypothetical protein
MQELEDVQSMANNHLDMVWTLELTAPARAWTLLPRASSLVPMGIKVGEAASKANLDMI